MGATRLAPPANSLMAPSAAPAAETSGADERNKQASDRVTVAVRMRPWISATDGTIVKAERERCAVRMRGCTAEVVDVRSGALKGRFTYDACFDSFGAGEAGCATQERVFDGLSPDLIRSCIEGYNVTVIAYGQTASGKSYTMIGTPEAPGFIPRFVEALFAAAGAGRPDSGNGSGLSPTDGAAPAVECAFEASYLEIYMEQIRDLLNPGRLGTRRRPGLADPGPRGRPCQRTKFRSAGSVFISCVPAKLLHIPRSGTA